MLTLLSPAKSLDFETPSIAKSATKPVLLNQSQILIDELRKLSAPKIASLMNISDSLAALNRKRFAAWETPFTKANAKQAILAFDGDVYRGLDAASFSPEDFAFAQKHLRILSGLYGVLRPLDLIQPYRLEMGTRLSNERGGNLYEFWDTRIAKELNKQLRATKSDKVVNLASQEYFKSVDTDVLKADVVTPAFLDFKNGNYKVISFYAKKARGYMSSWIIKNQVDDPEKLKKFSMKGYRFSKDLTEPGKPTFVRDKSE